MQKVQNNKAWWLVLPVFLLVAFSALIPLMTVVNYSVQDTFGNNEFFHHFLNPGEAGGDDHAGREIHTDFPCYVWAR